MKIAVIGQGYVGLPLSMAAAKAGHQVIGVDLDEKLVATLNSGVSPISDISNADIEANSKNYNATSDFKELNGAEIVAICSISVDDLTDKKFFDSTIAGSSYSFTAMPLA